MNYEERLAKLEEQFGLVEKKKKPYSSVTYTTGDPQLNIDHFNKMLMGKEENTHTSGYLNGTFKHDNKAAEQAAAKVGTFASQSPDGASSISTGAASSGSGDAGGSAGGVGESLVKDGNELEEAKRYVRRYYMRPQDIFCSNKDEVLKALIEHEDEDSVIYTLNNLGDNKDVHKLNDNDIIYYYEDGILYDKNHVRIMDYDLSIKHEEERAKINPNTVSDKTFADVYDDRMTELTQLEEELAADFDASQLDQFVGKTCTRKGVTGEFSYDFDDGELMGYITDDNGHVAMFDLEKAVSSGALVFNDAADTEAIRAVISGGEKSYGSGSNNKTVSTSQAKTPEEEAAARQQLIAEGEKEGKAFAESQFDTIIGKKNYQKFKNEEFDGDIYTFTMHQAYVKRYNELKVEKAKQGQAAKRSAKVAGIADQFAEDDATKEWLKNNIEKMYFVLPYSANRVANGKLTDKLIDKMDDRIAEYEKTFPNAVQGVDYDLKDIDYDEKWPDYQRGLGTVTFKDKIATAPQAVKDMILAAKTASAMNNTGAVADYDENSRVLNSTYFYYAVLKLFDNDINFYKQKEEKVEEAFCLNFESLAEDVDDNKCVICGEEIKGYGNNAEPYAHGRCCDACNLKFVLPARIEALRRGE